MARASKWELLMGTHGETGAKYAIDARDVMKQLEGLQMSNVIKRKDLRKVVRREVMGARKKVVQAAAGAMNSDPRGARNAVLGTVYKRVIGGSVSLFDKRTVKKMRVVKKKRGGASGIIRNRYKSDRSKQIEAYEGVNRGFILRFVNKGTVTRTANGKGGRGNRGAIKGKQFFEGTAKMAMQMAAENMKREVDRMITEIANER